MLSRGRRPCVPLGQLTKAQAQQAKGYIESLGIDPARKSGHAADNGRWLRDLDDDFYAVLVCAGLCDPRQAARADAEPDVRDDWRVR